MFTSRAEYRLLLRYDNADLRLMDIGAYLGLISEKMCQIFDKYRAAVISQLAGTGEPLPASEDIRPWTLERIEAEESIEKKYSGNIERQKTNALKQKKYEARMIPAGLDFGSITGLPTEAKQKFGKIMPQTIGQASRIPGITPADIALLMIHIERYKNLNATAHGEKQDGSS
jgi:tRNA uridine 5-carboxymethylaminomethyl modification enzyme